MSWVRLDDRFFCHRKVLSVSLQARWLFVAGLCVAAQHNTDGLLDGAAQQLLAVSIVTGDMASAAQELVKAGLWEAHPEGYQIHDYLEYQLSAEEQRKERAATAKRQADFRERRRNASRNGVTNAVSNGVENGTPSRPVPSRPVFPEEKLDEDQVAHQQKRTHVDLAGESSPPPRSGLVSDSPRTPAPVQGIRPAQQVALLPDEPKRDAPARQMRASKPEAPTAATWEAYAGAYTERYGNPPVRNARVNGQLTQLVAQLGADEAPKVAAFYLTHPAAIYNFHPIGLLLRDCQALRTQWQRGSVVTPTAARRNEEVASNPALALLLEQRRKKNGDG